MELPILKNILIIFSLSIIAGFLCHRFRMPFIVGFLLTGALVGPHALKIITSVHEVNTLAEIGVVLLLFTIGVEFSLHSLLRIKKTLLLGGTVQVFLTIAVCYVIARLIGRPVNEAVFWGFLISLSSTAIVLKLLQEKGEIESPHGRTILGILIFQDLISVPMMLLIPLLAGTTTTSFGSEILFIGLKGIGIIFFVIISIKWLVPHLLYQIAMTRNREIFLLTIIVICLTVAWFTNKIGLSFALGAFLAGLIISESEYSHQALSNILPFRDVFTSFFFISIGMLLNFSFFFNQFFLIIAIIFVILVIKAIIASLAALLLGMPLRTAVLAGVALGQIGEFSFILSNIGVKHNLLFGESYQLFLSCAVLSMMITPFLVLYADKIAVIIHQLPFFSRLKEWPSSEVTTKKHHLIIIGYGVNGRNVARSAKLTDIPYVIIEMNPETVKSEQTKGEPIFYGDATYKTVLEKANIEEAKVVVIAINDPAATRGITASVRQVNPAVYLIVRTRFLEEMKHLYSLGASEVIPEEFETSIEIFSRVLTKYFIPRDEIENLVSLIRSEGYEMFRNLSPEASHSLILKTELPDMEVCTFRITEKSCLCEKTLAELELRKKHGVTVLAVRRNLEIISNPEGSMPLQANDLLFVLALPEQLLKFSHVFLEAERKL